MGKRHSLIDDQVEALEILAERIRQMKRQGFLDDIDDANRDEVLLSEKSIAKAIALADSEPHRASFTKLYAEGVLKRAVENRTYQMFGE